MDIYTTRFMLRGRRVKFEFEGKKRRCKVQGVDTKTGELIVSVPTISTEYRIASRSLVTTPKRIPVKKSKKQSKA